LKSGKILTQDNCLKDSRNMDYEGQILILRPDVLKQEFRSVENQIWLGLRGFGCDPNLRGRAVYAKSLFDGQECRWNRDDFLGIAIGEYLPDWAKNNLLQEDQENEFEIEG
jgi:hypothetical protein